MKPLLNPALTPAAARALRQMIAEDEELVTEGIIAYVGSTRYSIGTVKKLLREVLVKDVSSVNDAMKRYLPNQDAQPTLDDPAYETRWRESMRTGQPIYR